MAATLLCESTRNNSSDVIVPGKRVLGMDPMWIRSPFSILEFSGVFLEIVRNREGFA